MSDNNNDSSPVVSSAAAAESSAAKRSHEEMETKNNETSTLNKETSINMKIDNDALFASGMERLKTAQIELINAQNNMESIRQQIRNSGDVEPDSLLC